MAEVLTLKKSNCKNCYKCIRHCPVKSIRFSGNQAHIIPSECILCGQCVVNCPQHAKQIVSEVEKVKVLIMSGSPVIASFAPSFAASYYGVGIESMEEALLKLGFTAAEETAVGATIVKREYERLIREDHMDVLITSCCHTVNLLIQKYFPDALPYLANVLSPMQAHCMDIKKRYPDAKTVFIGPCLSKKDEAQLYTGLVDAVLTFEELNDWMHEEGIEPEKKRLNEDTGLARTFPLPGGIFKCMTDINPDYNYISVDGMDSCLAVLKDVCSHKIHNCFIEMSACAGSCIGGPVMGSNRNSPVQDHIAVASYAGTKDFDVEQIPPDYLAKPMNPIPITNRIPTEEEITDALHKMGKYRPQDELNCGTCGYASCRDKAVAICQGKADVTMCLPFLKEKAESFSDSIINHSPNGILVLNEDLEVQDINKAACKIFNLRSEHDVLGTSVVQLMDPQVYVDVLAEGKSLKDERIFLADYDKYLETTVYFDEDSRQMVALFKDITDAERAEEERETIKKQTLEVADQVVEKQMRIVQEIASLLGETTAETKIALTKLKESLTNE